MSQRVQIGEDRTSGNSSVRSGLGVGRFVLNAQVMFTFQARRSHCIGSAPISSRATTALVLPAARTLSRVIWYLRAWLRAMSTYRSVVTKAENRSGRRLTSGTPTSVPIDSASTISLCLPRCRRRNSLTSIASSILRSKVISPLPALPLRPRVLSALCWSHWTSEVLLPGPQGQGEDCVEPARRAMQDQQHVVVAVFTADLDPLLDPADPNEAFLDDPIRGVDGQRLGEAALALLAVGQAADHQRCDGARNPDQDGDHLLLLLYVC